MNEIEEKRKIVFFYLPVSLGRNIGIKDSSGGGNIEGFLLIRRHRLHPQLLHPLLDLVRGDLVPHPPPVKLKVDQVNLQVPLCPLLPDKYVNTSIMVISDKILFV